MQDVDEQFGEAVVGYDYQGQGYEHHVCVAPGAKDYVCLMLLL